MGADVPAPWRRTESKGGGLSNLNVRIPSATYRLQFHGGFQFQDAIPLVPYLQRLGISDVYSSPILKARPGSTHGYDVVDHSVVNPELGGEDALRELASALRNHGIGMVVDIVPNHMGVLHESNLWWWDVLENGPGAQHAPYFDIDWNPPKEELQNRVLIPTLGQQFGSCLEAGELTVRYSEDGAFTVHYYDKIFPTGPRTWTPLLLRAAELLREQMSVDDEDLMELESISTALHNLPLREETEPDRMAERQREKEVAKRRLRALSQNAPAVRKAIEQVLTELNGTPGDASSYDWLEQFLTGQAYRLSFWRVAPDEINYRRFFDINELAAIRVEEPTVFKEVHELIFRLIHEGLITGLRIDHPDGLYNPPQYFTDLQRGCYLALTSGQVESEDFPAHSRDFALWVVVEKILARQEHLREDWLVHGTSGYDYLNLVNGVFVDTTGERSLLKTYGRFVGSNVNFSNLMYECKKLILDVAMSGELNVLSRRIDRISEQHRRTRDFTLDSLQNALREFIACFPVYRSYTRPDSSDVREDDRRYIMNALRQAKRRNPSIDPSIYDFLGSVLLMEQPEGITEEHWTARRDFVLRLQQFTGPVMAKGLEDTAFYREFPLVSLNEVGGEPEHFGVTVEEYHRRCREDFDTWPHAMLGTSTHDTKRSEDVRARINVISEIPKQWDRTIQRWRMLNRKRKRQVEGIHVPTTNEEYLLYQSLAGVWPLDVREQEGLVERFKAYMIKATREAKVHTSWVSVNGAHEEALTAFIDDILNPAKSLKFLREVESFVESIAVFGAINSLGQVLLKSTSPGVPDFYQGQELWDFSLVDPDNRRPVDYKRRIQLLESMSCEESSHDQLKDILENWQDGRIKMYVTHHALCFRRDHREIYDRGEYVGLEAEGPLAKNVISFARSFQDQWAITAVPRLLANSGLPQGRLTGLPGWTETSLRLPPGAPAQWRNIMTSETATAENGQLPLSFLTNFPVALLRSM